MKKERKLSPLRAVVRILPLVVKHSPGWVTLEMLLTMLVSVLSAVTVYCNQFFYDALLHSANGSETLSHTVLGAVIVLAVMFLNKLTSRK